MGDTVIVTKGSANWGTSTLVWDAKNITLQGAGIDVTIITSDAVRAMMVGFNGPTKSRITGMTLTAGGGAAIQIDGNGWRVDHMKIQSATVGKLVWGVNGQGARSADYPGGVPYGPTGLIDHNIFIDSNALAFGLADNAIRESTLWVSPSGWGDGNAVYVEDNTFIMHGEDDMTDCNYGGRIVVRFNQVIGNGSGFNIHSNQGQRSCRRWEIYKNTMNTTNGFFLALELRGGNGVAWGNAINSLYTTPIAFQNVRSSSEAMDRPPIGTCNGTSSADGNAGLKAAPGWPCRDQIGWNTDAFPWTVLGTAPPQLHEPAYLWSNTHGGKLVTSVPVMGLPVPDATAYIQPNRDYYIQGSTFDGTSGLGVGTLAERPATCKTYGDDSGAGVGYWATDQGSWNTLGENGVLYRCSSANTWTVYYTPYTYPHPLQAGITGGDTSAPIAPLNLKVQ